MDVQIGGIIFGDMLQAAGTFDICTRRERLQIFGLRETLQGLSQTGRFSVAFELCQALKRHGVKSDADTVDEVIETLVQRLNARLKDTTIERLYETETVKRWAQTPYMDQPMMPPPRTAPPQDPEVARLPTRAAR